ncbi:MAG TPA: hypothetical protein VK578_06705 [Edaphobacter sp.]|jgi:hypothetical protein|nr:hypothetical protein [Edaphobacter sp.]
MTDHAIALLTLILTGIGVLIAGVGIGYAVKTLRAGAEIARAQFWVMVRGVLANYDDVHAKLRPEGIWGVPLAEKYSLQGPQDAAEWARLELYMGMFEYCETLLTHGLLDEKEFSDAYRYRLDNLVHNAVIVREKLHERGIYWKKFSNLCGRLRVPIPRPGDLPPARDSSQN